MNKGFSLLEVLVSLAITLIVGAAVFQLFQQNEHVFHDQNLIAEMQQGARAAIAQSASEIRMAGQGVPLYAASYDTSLSEGAVAILPGSSASRINFRVSLAAADAAVVSPVPALFTAGSPINLTVDNATGLYNAIGGSPVGRFVYFWGAVDPSRPGWVRASVNAIVPSTKNVQVTAAETGPSGAVQFSASPLLSLEEAVALYHDIPNGTMRRTTATNMSDVSNPTWAPANELMPNVTLLRFEYFDTAGTPVAVDTLAGRARVAQVAIQLVVQSAADLSNHTRPSYGTSVRTRIRSALLP